MGKLQQATNVQTELSNDIIKAQRNSITKHQEAQKRAKSIANRAPKENPNDSQLYLSLHTYDNIEQGLYNSEVQHSEKDKYFMQNAKYDDYIDF